MEAEVKKEEPVVDEVPQPSIEDMAAHDYEVCMEQFEKQLEELSNRQLKRTVLKLFKYPFQDVDLKSWAYPQEKELFRLGSKIMDCRFVLMKAAFAMKEEHIKTLMAENAVNESLEVGKLKEALAPVLKGEEDGENTVD